MTLPYDDGRRVDLPERVIFDERPYAVEWDADGKPIRFARKTAAELRDMAASDAHIRATGQPLPYIKPAHFTDPVPGFLGPIRFAIENGAAKLYAGVQKCVGWLADQVLNETRPWLSVEILADASSANYMGLDGKPLLKSLVAGAALINTHPRKKTIEAGSAYACNFSEPGALPGSFLVTFEEGAAMALSGEQTIALLKALGGDQKLLEKAVAAINGEADGAPKVEDPPKPAGDGAPVIPMSDLAAARFAKLESDNNLLRVQVDEQRKQREADVRLDRMRQVCAFSDAVSMTHGKAIADAAKIEAEKRFAFLPKCENFADGKDIVAEVFSDIKTLLGPATVRRVPGAATSPGGSAGVESFSEEAAKVEIFADVHHLELAHLQSPAGKPLLDSLIAKRKADHEKARVA